MGLATVMGAQEYLESLVGRQRERGEEASVSSYGYGHMSPTAFRGGRW